ncbi:FAD-binding oxidoreductase [Sphingomonas sp. KRR8]|uniref:FAD-binding oxidoreductase n=1 Tax=Sphingomonas sp. KRR8 TaxID=2942996 RepID=UPI0020228B1D|nr:FAD-binding oxidoreductase [Sphingomonas sp. KRR8]URD61078.1 FAD-binding oxidoreductase [Sphingomonas sp. KRR8]
MSSAAQMIERLRPSLGARGVLTDSSDIHPWLTDWRGKWTGRAAALLQPASTDEVADVVRLAEEYGVPLVPQGGNTSMVGGATPDASGACMLLSLRRLNKVRSIGDGVAVAEAGVILADLQATALERGQRFPLTLGAHGSATVGGLASTNAGGTQVLRFGTMRQLVTGVEAVLSGGLVHDGLAGLKKDNRGYALDQLLVGAEGTLGVITAVAVRLVPAVRDRAVAWVGLASPQQGLDLLRFLQAHTDAVEGFEILPQDSLDRVLRYIPDTRAPLTGTHPWHVLIEATSTSDRAQAPGPLLQNLLAAALDAGLLADATIAASDTQAEAFWRIRHSISEAEKRDGPALQHDISVPVGAMPRFMIEAAAAVEKAFPGTDASGFGHLGDGNVHFHVRAPAHGAAAWMEQEGSAASRLVHDLVTEAGGSISAEHGIGQMKREELQRLSSPARLFALGAIKRAMDPHNIFNPGKLID